MGKDQKQRKRVDGPYLDAACICEQVLQDEDDTYSLIRLVNRLTVYECEYVNGAIIALPLTLFVKFTAGSVKGKRELFLYQINPSGKRTLMRYEQPIQMAPFRGEDTGEVLIIPEFRIQYEKDGIYWVDIVLEKKWHSRIPIRITTSKNRMPNPPPSISSTENKKNN
jgi:hypothetical protein